MSKILPLVFYPDHRLRERSLDIDPNNIAALLGLASDMSKTMIADKGIGLAAPQVGKNIRLIIVSTKSGPQVMFNPKIVGKSLLQEWGEEGCLSIPGVFGNVKRYRTVECSFLDTEGKKQSAKAEGLLARIIQHEIDHLDGVLFIDRAEDIRQE